MSALRIRDERGLYVSTSDPRTRFEAKIDREGPPNMALGGTRCWIWTGARNFNEYGVFRLYPKGKGALVLAHRFSYALYVGAFDPILTINHRCFTRLCVNALDHLELMTHLENSQLHQDPYPDVDEIPF